jgi:hypothetical protein
VVASSTCDMGTETAARAARGDGYAETRELTARAHEQRERGKPARARGNGAALTGGAARAERGEGEEGARAGWARWAERPRGAGVWAFFPFSFILAIVFPFYFYLLYLIQFQKCHKFKLALPSIMPPTKVKFRVYHDVTIHTPLEFGLIDFNYPKKIAPFLL